MTALTGLEAARAAVMAKVNADLGVTVSSKLSTRVIVQHDSPPRAVWVPSRDTVTDTQRAPRGANGRALATYLRGVDVYLWAAPDPDAADPDAASVTALETLRDAVIRALRQTFGTSDLHCRIPGGAWRDRVGDTDLGDAYVLSVALAIDVAETPATTAPVTSMPFDPTASTPGDGVIAPGEP